MSDDEIVTRHYMLATAPSRDEKDLLAWLETQHVEGWVVVVASPIMPRRFLFRRA